MDSKKNVPLKKNEKPKLFERKKNQPVFKTDFSKFNTDTGEKVANVQMNLARMEASSEAKKNKRSANSNEETLKDSATGGSLAFLVASPAITKDSTRIKALTALRKKGLIGVAGAIGAGVLSRKKQKSEYNQQQAARELIAGKETGRSSAYKKYLSGKYRLESK